MITRFKKYLITESPDELRNDNKIYSFSAKDAKAFFINVNSDHTKVEKLFMSAYGKAHGDIKYWGSNKAYAGRLWVKKKVMAFWIYPNEILFRDIVKKIEEKLNIKIFNNGWKIEIIKTDDVPGQKGGIKRKEFDPNQDNYYYYFGSRHGNWMTKYELIPVEEYAGSEDVPEEEYLMHLKKWQDKEKDKKPGEINVIGFGSDKTAWDRPHNIKYRHTIYQENNNQ